MNHRNPTERLEDELDRAKGLGRWLSDDEQAELDRAADAVAERLEARKRRQRKLVVLTAVCLLIPPLWPLALGLTLFLLYPDTHGQDRAGRRCRLIGRWIAAGWCVVGGHGLAGSIAFLISPNHWT